MADTSNTVTADEVAYEYAGATSWVTLNRPGALNALSPNLIHGIRRCLARAEDDGARSVVICANGRMFCAGADIAAGREMLRTQDGMAEFLADAWSLMNAIESFSRPVIAAVEGDALGGGLELILACDLVVAWEGARFSDGHAKYGLFPAAGAASRMPRLIGASRAKYMLFTGEWFSTTEMESFGAVNRVVAERQDVRAVAAQVAERIASHRQGSIDAMKRVVNDGMRVAMDEALVSELEEAQSQSRTAEWAEGIEEFHRRS